MDSDALEQLYSENTTAQAFFDHAARRRRTRWETTVERTMENLANDGHDVTRADIVRLFKRLAEIGCGQFIVGRHNHRSRFSWETELTGIARVAAGESQELEPIDESRGDESEEDWLLEHSYHLREEYELKMSLPYDLTRDEADRLAGFIKTLPFECE